MFRRELCGIVIALAAGVPCGAEPAHFWLSASSTAPGAPETPTFNISSTGTGQVFVWGRPMTDKKVVNLSLNLIASQPGIDFLDTGITVFNTISGPLQRFEFVSDASSTPPLQSTRTRTQVMGGQADSIRGLQGFTLAPNFATRGIGAKCVGGESGCGIAPDGQPAWLIATASFNAIQPGSTTNLFLQVGERGINHETVPLGDHDFNGLVERADYDAWFANFGSNNSLASDDNGDGIVNAADYIVWRNNFGGAGVVEPTNMTSVRFGVGPVSTIPEPIYNASTDRQVTFTNDHADAVIQVAGPGSGTIASVSVVPEPATVVLLLVCFSIGVACGRATRRPSPRQ